MALASHARPSHLASRLRRRNLRKLSAELARLEMASSAARAERKRLEETREAEARTSAGAGTASSDDRVRARAGSSRTNQVLAAARRREESLRIAIGDCRAEIFKQLLRGARWKDDERPRSPR